MIIYSNGEKIEIADGVSKVEFENELKKKQDSATAITMEEVIKAISEAAIQTQDVYTVEEQRVGTWIDGKPFYRKVFIGAINEPQNAWNTMSSIDPTYEPKMLDAYQNLSNGTLSIIPLIEFTDSLQNSIYISMTVDKVNSVISYRFRGNALIGRGLMVYLYYTKTTDQATIEIPSIAVLNNLTDDTISQSTFAFDPLDQQVGILPDGRSIFEHIIQTTVSITESETIVASMPNIELVAPITGIVDGQNGSEWYGIPGSYSDFQYGLSYVKETGDIKLYASSTSISEKTLRLFVRYVLPAEKDISTLEEP